MTEPDAHGWLPIDSAPRDGTYVDLWSAVWTSRVPDCAWRGGKWWHWTVGYKPSEFDPTHWRPLGPPPVAVARGQS